MTGASGKQSRYVACLAAMSWVSRKESINCFFRNEQWQNRSELPQTASKHIADWCRRLWQNIKHLLLDIRQSHHMKHYTIILSSTLKQQKDLSHVFPKIWKIVWLRCDHHPEQLSSWMSPTKSMSAHSMTLFTSCQRHFVDKDLVPSLHMCIYNMPCHGTQRYSPKILLTGDNFPWTFWDWRRHSFEFKWFQE